MSGLDIDRLTRRNPAGGTLLGPLDLCVAPGERIAVVGPNGAGKTTLLRLLSARLDPCAGTVSLGGRVLHDLGGRERALAIAVLGQDEPADARFDVLDYVALGRLPHQGRCGHAEHAAAVARALERCGVAHLGGRALSTLSGGERQRVRLARALAQAPAVLLLDEPTNHLDLRARIELLELVAGLGITVIAVLHELSLVTGFADRVLVLQAGRVAAIGPPAQALDAGLVAEVFGLDVFTATHPRHGRPSLVFDRIAG